MQYNETGMGETDCLQHKDKLNPYKRLMRIVQLILAITITSIAAVITIYYTQ